MSSWPAKAALFIALLVSALARADEETLYAMTQEDEALVGVGTASVPGGYVNVKAPWIDRAHDGVFNAVWRSAARMDRWFGGSSDESAYQETSGSIAPALLYDEYDGFKPRLRFQVDVPLPQMNKRLHAFIGRVNPDEYVTERRPGSGAFARQYGPVEDDETLFGIRYREPNQGGRFDADAGLRLRSPLDPFVKASYRFHAGTSETTLLSFRETVFWQNSASGTFSERTEGVRGYSALMLLRGFPNRRAAAAELFTEGEFDDIVPLRNYGLRVAYRRSIVRDWLVLETRASVTFPREYAEQEREASFGVGIGLEMFFGTDDFLARPVTF
jgi:hypothetical protein